MPQEPFNHGLPRGCIKTPDGARSLPRLLVDWFVDARIGNTVGVHCHLDWDALRQARAGS